MQNVILNLYVSYIYLKPDLIPPIFYEGGKIRLFSQRKYTMRHFLSGVHQTMLGISGQENDYICQICSTLMGFNVTLF